MHFHKHSCSYSHFNIWLSNALFSFTFEEFSIFPLPPWIFSLSLFSCFHHNLWNSIFRERKNTKDGQITWMCHLKKTHRHQVPFTRHLLTLNQLPSIYYFSWLHNLPFIYLFHTKPWKLGDSISVWWVIKNLSK